MDLEAAVTRLTLHQIGQFFRYELVNSYVKFRWIIFCLTGLWGFGETKDPPQTDPIVEIRQRIMASMTLQRGSSMSILQRGRLQSSVANLPHTLPRTDLVPRRVRYLGQFYYPSWDDRRWKPTEKDYDADDEAED